MGSKSFNKLIIVIGPFCTHFGGLFPQPREVRASLIKNRWSIVTRQWNWIVR